MARIVSAKVLCARITLHYTRYVDLNSLNSGFIRAIPKFRFECAAHFFVNQTVHVSQGVSLPMKCTALDWLTLENRTGFIPSISPEHLKRCSHSVDARLADDQSMGSFYRSQSAEV